MRVILGCYMSSTRKAVLPALERWNALLLYPTLYEGFEYSRHVIYTGAAPNQNSVQLAEFMMRKFGSRVFMVGLGLPLSLRVEPDHERPDPRRRRREGRRALPAARCDAGGFPYGGEADQGACSPTSCSRPWWATAPRMLHQAYAEAGWTRRACRSRASPPARPKCSRWVRSSPQGHITSAPYFQSIDTDNNRRCVEAFQRRFGDDVVANQCWEAAYFQTHLLANAMRRVDPGDVDALLRVLPGSEFDAPQGRCASTNTTTTPTCGRASAAADADGQFEILEQARALGAPGSLPRLAHARRLVRARQAADA